MKRLWRFCKRHPFLLSYLLVVVVGASGFVAQRRQDQRTRRQSAAICATSRSSWDGAHEIVLLFTEPSILSPEAQKLFPPEQTASLRLQIDHANRVKAANRARLLRLQGPRPSC